MSKPEYAPSAYNPAYHEDTDDDDDDDDDDEGRKDDTISTSKHQPIKIREENVKAVNEELRARIYSV